MLRRFLDVRPGEGRVLVPALAFAFSCVGAQTLAFIASDTLFVSTFSVSALSRFYLVAALARVAVSLLYGALTSRDAGARDDTRTLLFAGAAAVGSWSLVRTGADAAVYAACTLMVAVPSLLPLVAMSAALDRFDARQAKRLFPLLGAAATSGAIAVGGLANLLAPRLGAPSLLLASSLLCMVGATLPSRMAAASHTEPAPAEHRQGRSQDTRAKQRESPWALLRRSFGDVRDLPAVRVFAVGSLLAAAATVLVDYAFKAALKARFGRDEMASFLGTFNVVTEAVVLVVQLFFTSRALAWLGVRSSLQARAVVLLPFGPLLAALPGVATATAGKFVESVMRFSIGGTAADLLLTPASAAVRGRAKLLAKAVVLPLGSLVAGAALSPFGVEGPSPVALGLLLTVTAALSVAACAGAGRAYTSLLVGALGRPGATLDESAEAAMLLRRELSSLLADTVRAGDAARAEAVLGLGATLLTLDELAPALGAPGELGRAAARLAVRVAGPADGARLLELAPPSDDDALESELLARARALGAPPAHDRLLRAVARGEADAAGAAAAKLWAEAQVCLALAASATSEPDLDVAAELRAAAAQDSPRRAAALRALGELRDGAAHAEIERALSASDPAVFAEAARAAVLTRTPGAVRALIDALGRGPHAGSAGRALVLAGDEAVGPLLDALARAGRGVGAHGEVPAARVAHVLGRLGAAPCARALGLFPTLGYGARAALARTLAASPASMTRALEPALVSRAIELTLAHVEALRDRLPTAAGLLRRELRCRLEEAADRLLDLASALGERRVIARARAALRADARTRSNALELLENVLPAGAAKRTVALLEDDGAASRSGRPARRSAAPGGVPRASAESFGSAGAELDPWLERCRRFDARELSSDDPMRTVLDKLLALGATALFEGLSTEELYPVAEIAAPVSLSPGDNVVRQGDPGDALFVVVSGSLAVVQDGKRVRELGPGAAFGEIALLDGSPRSATIDAATAAELLRIPRVEFGVLLDESPELARGVIRTLVGYLRDAR